VVEADRRIQALAVVSAERMAHVVDLPSRSRDLPAQAGNNPQLSISADLAAARRGERVAGAALMISSSGDVVSMMGRANVHRRHCPQPLFG
jgi:hypothetical protein